MVAKSQGDTLSIDRLTAKGSPSAMALAILGKTGVVEWERVWRLISEATAGQQNPPNEQELIELILLKALVEPRTGYLIAKSEVKYEWTRDKR